jgi:hypothetical protein
MSGFIAVKDYLKYGITEQFSQSGGPFPEPFDQELFKNESKQVQDVYFELIKIEWTTK